MTSSLLFGERYQLGETLGFGGMSEVHRGRDLRLGRDVAIKVLRADLARDPSFLARFRREAQNSASLNHPAIVAVYDTGESLTDPAAFRNGDTATANGDQPAEKSNIPYIVMEYVDGLTLRELIRRDGPMTARRAMEIMADVCAALDFSHRHGIVHRDVKPGNIMLTRAGAVKVMDFGIARALNDASTTQTATAAVIGTAQYLSPEQARGETVDARSDVYATGCVLFELLTGTPPFTGDSPVAIAYQHVREDPKAPSEIDPSVTAELDAIVLKALNKNPMNRYQSAAEMRSDLVRALSGQAVQATPVMSDDERTELMRATPARTPAASALLAPPSRAAAMLPLADEESNTARKVWGWVGIGALCVALIAAMVWVTVSVIRQPERAQELPVPDVVSLSYDEAVAKLREAGFSADATTVPVEVDDAQVGKVQAQNPSARTIRPTTDKVKLSLGVRFALVKVPNVLGMSQEAADKALKDAKLVPTFVQEVSAATDKDRAFSQTPAQGSDQKPGSTVTVKIGLGVKLITPPDIATLVGQPQEQVAAALKALGFEVFAQSTPSSLPVNQVVSISGVQPGQQVQEGTPVTVAYSDNTLFKIPNIRNLAENPANALLVQNGWAAGNTIQVTRTITTNPAQYNVVIDQTPAADTEYQRNGVIKVTIGIPQQITFPEVRGRTEAEARAILTNAQHTGKVTIEGDPAATGGNIGKVLKQTPEPNTPQPANVPVTLTVGGAVAPATSGAQTPR
jgi:eukaryotic-like serine/threonine-protein kinase